jgi:hypothetical protein
MANTGISRVPKPKPEKNVSMEAKKATETSMMSIFGKIKFQ